MDSGAKMAVFGPRSPVTEIGASHSRGAVQVCHRNCLMRLLRKAIAAGNELSRARCGTRNCGELELQPIGRISLTGPRKARPDDKPRRNPPRHINAAIFCYFNLRLLQYHVLSEPFQPIFRLSSMHAA